jgi:hypothetical protein
MEELRELIEEQSEEEAVEKEQYFDEKAQFSAWSADGGMSPRRGSREEAES